MQLLLLLLLFLSHQLYICMRASTRWMFNHPPNPVHNGTSHEFSTFKGQELTNSELERERERSDALLTTTIFYVSTITTFPYREWINEWMNEWIEHCLGRFEWIQICSSFLCVCVTHLCFYAGITSVWR